MKKQFLTVAVAALALAGCSKNETVEVADSRAIGFESFVGKATRAVTELTDDGIHSFCVYGGYDNMTQVFDNQEVTSKDGKAWEYSPTRYWVAGKNYKFAAYAPKDVASYIETDFANGHLNVNEYVSDPTNQFDLIYSGGITKTPTAAETGTVNFTFSHLLSMVKLTFVSGFGKDIKVEISDLKFFGMFSKNTYTGTDESWTTATEAIATPGFTEMSSVTTAENKNTGEVVKAESTPFVVVPQTSEDVTVSFKVTVKDASDNIVVNAKELTGTITTPTWDKGNRYNYVITISGEDTDLYPIVIGDPTVTEWGGYSDSTVDVQ